MKKIKQLVLASAVLAAPFLAHADLKSMDDSALAGVTGQDGISIAGTFTASIGSVTYTDGDTNGGSLVLGNITLPSLTIDENNPLKVDVVGSSTLTGSDGKPVQQLQLTLPSITGSVGVGSIKVGSNGASIGSLAINDLNLAGSTIKVWGH
ncbi:DUF6160 family protein [Pseudomonas panipatensis]|uniref:DUF6160 domain-containing protein n=1 Tax=Pseudomonas panipatensis TaxID=428992 RepID=A0A1G8F9H8_9PSED|nr:DUF6160 family protein [Pseudomonas panipatensis]SDH78781.1 hypothetical protein SAMN05216272_103105 [Pseudomonas panipatensis]SMP54906.1 hypothetical protein SAMN06295951_103354 [Pseudomonas panipatensis]